MANLTKDRVTAELASGGKTFRDPLAANAKIFMGSMVGLDATGNAVRAAPAVTRMRGVAVAGSDNTGGAAGAVTVEIKRGVFQFPQTGLTRARIGTTVFVVDDNTVGATGTLIAGKLLDIETAGAWVEIL